MSLNTRIFLNVMLLMMSASTQAIALENKEQTAEAAIHCDAEPSQNSTDICYSSGVSISIRDEKGTESTLRGKFPIGTKIRIRGREGDWLNVKVYGKNNDEAGWVLKNEVQPTPPNLSNLIQQFYALVKTDYAARLELAERAIALEPLNQQAHELGYVLYHDMGDFTALQKARSVYQEIQDAEVIRAANEPALIFTVDNGMASPFVQLENQTLQKVQVANLEERPWLEQAEPTYFRSGRALHFYQRGAYKAKLRVVHKERTLCESDSASVVDESGRPIDMLVDGVASNIELTQPESNHAREMTSEEYAAIEKLLAVALKKQGMKKIGITNFFQLMKNPERNHEVQRMIIPSGKQGEEWLFISFVVTIDEKKDGINTQHYGFLIAEKTTKNSYRTMHSQIEDNHGGESYNSLRFLDYLDLDQDGINELIFTGYGFESWWYEAWQLKGKAWKQTVHGGGGGC